MRCGVAPPQTYSSRGLSNPQRVTRFFWQNAERPNRAALEPIRNEVSRRHTGSPGPIPNQPGPYFTLEIGRDSGAVVRIVCIDTGIDGSIDVGQQLWLAEVLSDRLPVILVTGKPLVVNEDIHDFYVADRVDEQGSIPRTVRQLLQSHPNVVATLAGDTHNYQRLILGGEPSQGPDGEVELHLDADALKGITEKGLPPLQLIAGGGGAYLAATHTTHFCRDENGQKGCLRLKEKQGPARRAPRAPRADDEESTATDPDLELNYEPLVLSPGHHFHYPSREQSLAGFEKKVGRRTAIVPLVLAALGVLTAIWTCSAANALGSGDEVNLLGQEDISTDRFVLAALLGAILISAIGPVLGALRGARQNESWSWRHWVITALLSTLSTTVAILWWVPLEVAAVYAAGVAAVLVLPALVLAAPIMNAFPQVRAVIPWRSLLALLGAAAVAIHTPTFLSGSLVAVGVVLVSLLIFGILRGVRWAEKKVRNYTVDGINPKRRFGWRFVQTVGPFFVLASAVYLIPRILGAEADEREMLYFLSLLELLLAIAVIDALVLVALARQAERGCPDLGAAPTSRRRWRHHAVAGRRAWLGDPGDDHVRLCAAGPRAVASRPVQPTRGRRGEGALVGIWPRQPRLQAQSQWPLGFPDDGDRRPAPTC